MAALTWLCIQVTLLCLFSQSERRNGASASPVRQPMTWARCKEESRRLYESARKLYESNRTSPDIGADQQILHKPPKIHCAHKCDPGSLIQDKMVCLRHVHRTLQWYHSFFQLNDVYASIDSDLTKAIRESLNNLEDFLKAVTGQHITSLNLPTMNNWEKRLMAEYVARNLLNYSILVARTFYPGDPAKHLDR